MRLEWIVLLLLLVLPIMIADIDTSMRNDNSAISADQQYLTRSHRFKRATFAAVEETIVAFASALPDSFPFCPPLICCKPSRSGAGQVKEISWWLHILLVLLPMSVSWMKTMIL
ncbi:hypothetical protein X798_07606 [Onchocerca flexuosa]|uniref:Uncharacterized protein n=1 Tax=Onchocerca flexuosa TaxID=387005 RepID=A0A238BJ61_9BILA|nr:hypothetical protein X798_07606 [Onchocerca flexuosa]